jgi:hypothetical protein
MKAKHFFLIAPIVAIMTYLFISFVNGRAEKKAKEIYYRGVITKIHQEPMQHNMYFFDIHTKEYGETETTASFWRHSWKYASVGDSIIKPPDTLMIIIKKPDGNSKEFFYR